MIIYSENQPPLLSDYGIEIPMLKTRAERIRSEILKNFGKSVFCLRGPRKLNNTDLTRAHSLEFIANCETNPIAVVEQTFELKDATGNYHRYSPGKATKALSELVALYKESCELSYLCLEEAKKNEFAYYLGGGFHHSLSTQGRGFCLFNDIMIAARKFQADIENKPIWIIDIDAHKGCGTAEIAQSDHSIHTLSIHMSKGWPLDSESHDKNGKLNPWFIPSTIDIGINSGEEDLYLDKLTTGLEQLEFKAKELPALCIVVDGSDPYEGDALPSSSLLKLTKEQCLQRNLIVYDFLKKRNIPQAYLMSGGYGDKNWIIHYQFIEEILNRRK